MTAASLLPLLKGVTLHGMDRWSALCPYHESDGKPHRASLSIRETSDRLLLHCHAGCSTKDVCAAIGITTVDLFSHRPGRPDPMVDRRRRAAEGLELWRQAEVQRVAEELRTRDIVIQGVVLANRNGLFSENDLFITLEHEYRGYSELEYRFERLLNGSDTLQLWRESRSV